MTMAESSAPEGNSIRSHNAGSSTTTTASQCGPPSAVGDSHEQLNRATNTFHFHAGVDINGTLGVGMPGAPPRRSLTGRLSPTEIQRALQHYVEPEPYNDALRALQENRVTVLRGMAGTGKRTGAIALMREVTDAPLIVLSPATPPLELASRTYEKEYAYLIINHRHEDRSADIDLAWRRVCDQVADAQTFMAVTTTDVRREWAERIHCIDWRHPPALRVLRAHLAETPHHEEIVQSIVDAVPDEYTMAQLVGVARRIDKGIDLVDALQEFDVASRREVRSWFDEHSTHWDTTTRREILEIAALAFCEGQTERAFESHITQLEACLDDWLPAHIPPEGAGPAETPWRGRSQRAGGEGLIVIRHSVDTGARRRTVHFKAEGYRHQVIIELWERFEIPFWNGIHAWLNSLIGEGSDSGEASEDQLEVACGLAILATITVDEVQDLFLEPWSRGEQAWWGQYTATYVLWHMCYDDVLGPVALRTAVRWATAGNRHQRWTAAMAFSGPLGATYPTDAVSRLWKIMAQSADPTDACIALANLFSLLVQQTEEDPESRHAIRLLSVLRRELDRFRPRGAAARPLLYTLTAIMAVLSSRDLSSNNPSAFVLLHARPDHTDSLGQLWAAVLRHRSFRREALEELRRGLHSLRRISTDPMADAQRLGEALAKALPRNEHTSVCRELSAMNTQTRVPATASLIRVLLTALQRLSQYPSAKD